MNELEWLMSWYRSNCNDDWEHQFGIKIGTLDNPGWTLTIDLTGTALADRDFVRIDQNLVGAQADLDDNASWWSCHIANHQFHAACGAKDLNSVLAIFRTWAQQ